MARLWREITISDSRQRSDREVARCDHLVVAGRILQSVCGDEVRLLSVEETRYEVEETADEVSDNDCEQNQSEDTVDIFHNEREYDFFGACLIRE